MRDQQKASGSIRSWLKIAKLSCLVSENPEQAEPELWHLKYSRAEVHAALIVIKFLPQLMTLRQQPMPLAEQYAFFKNVGSAFPAVSAAAVGFEVPIAAIAPLIERFLTEDDPVAHPCPLVTGRDLMTQLQLPPGPCIGQLLEAIQLAQAEGKISTPTEALTFAKSAVIPKKGHSIS